MRVRRRVSRAQRAGRGCASMEPILRDLTALPSSALTHRLYELRRDERHILIEFLHYLG